MNERLIIYAALVLLNLHALLGLLKNSLFIPGIHSKDIYLTGIGAYFATVAIAFFSVAIHFIVSINSKSGSKDGLRSSIILALTLAFLSFLVSIIHNLLR